MIIPPSPIGAGGSEQSGCPRAVSLWDRFFHLNEWRYFNDHNHSRTLTTLRRSRGQRSRSAGDGHRNLVNSTAPEPLKGFEPELTQILPTVGPRTHYVARVMGSKVKVTETFCGGGVLINVRRRLPRSLAYYLKSAHRQQNINPRKWTISVQKFRPRGLSSVVV